MSTHTSTQDQHQVEVLVSPKAPPHRVMPFIPGKSQSSVFTQEQLHEEV